MKSAAKQVAAKPGRRSSRLTARRRTAPGASPGTIVIDASAAKPRLQVIAYDSQHLEEEPDVAGLEALRRWVGNRGVTWVNVEGLGDAELIRGLADLFGLHRLVIEDVVNVHQRVKSEDYEEYLFVVCRMPRGGGPVIETEQVSIIIGAGILITFQERGGDCFDQIRKRLRKAGSKIRESGADYLGYALIDAIVDSYFPVLEVTGEILEALEDETLHRPVPQTLQKIHDAKRELMVLRRVLWAQREMLSSLQRGESPAISEGTRVYLRDCHDHAFQLIEFLENCREVAAALMDVYMSTMSHRMNEIMKVLTIVATIFIPLTFIVGIYGMNFDADASSWNMPELAWRYGYPACLLVMATIAGALLWYFRRLGWLGGD